MKKTLGSRLQLQATTRPDMHFLSLSLSFLLSFPPCPSLPLSPFTFLSNASELWYYFHFASNLSLHLNLNTSGMSWGRWRVVQVANTWDLIWQQKFPFFFSLVMVSSSFYFPRTETKSSKQSLNVGALSELHSVPTTQSYHMSSALPGHFQKFWNLIYTLFKFIACYYWIPLLRWESRLEEDKKLGLYFSAFSL